MLLLLLGRMLYRLVEAILPISGALRLLRSVFVYAVVDCCVEVDRSPIKIDDPPLSYVLRVVLQI